MRNLIVQIPREVSISPEQIFEFIRCEAHLRVEKILEVKCDEFGLVDNGDITSYTDYGHHRGGEVRNILPHNMEAYEILSAIKTIRGILLS